MNWNQVYATATRDQRQEIALLLLEYVRTHPPLRYHFVGLRNKNQKVQVLSLGVFIFILITLSLGAWLVSLNIPPSYGAPLVFAWNFVLAIILLIRPMRHTHWA